ncbi:MAG: hypothetical protein QOE05_3499 [Actinomycetota bacterium]|jgi:hypothetical protein|nr:hypothetical protein [Actinomycetota bacterium]
MRIDRRYNGPPSSGNGGVSCGLLAAYVDAPTVEVTLRRPPPLDVEMTVAAGELYDGEVLVASAASATVDVDPHPPVSLEQAAAAEPTFTGFVEHPFPGCFVCGTDRTPPDGLGLRPGRIGDGVVATRWTPTSDEPFLTWAALDCPGAWAGDVPGRLVVLGRMTLQQLVPPRVGEPHVVVGWTVGHEGRKTYSGTALYDATGALHAIAHQTWIALPS